jgi:hypothetical protein
LDRTRRDAAECRFQAIAQIVQRRRLHQCFDDIVVLHEPRDGRQDLEVIARLFIGEQHENQPDGLVRFCSFMTDTRATTADRQNVATLHLHAHVRQRHARAEIRGHRAFALQQPAEQGVPFQLRRTRDGNLQQLFKRALQIGAAQINDAASCDYFLQPHDENSGFR